MLNQSRFLKDDEYNQTRRTINSGLRNYAQQNDLLLVDLEKEIPHLSLTDDQKSMWDDDLHFSPAGYDRFGALIFDALQKAESSPES